MNRNMNTNGLSWVKMAFIISCLIIVFCQSCNKGITYAEQKEKEKDAIQSWITRHDYRIITEEQFFKQDTVTNENEFVFLKKSGVYMNIIQRGKGKETLSDGRYTVVSRYIEIALSDLKDTFAAGDTLSGNMNLKNFPQFGNPEWELYQYMQYPDNYILTKDDEIYKATFKDVSMMGYVYQNSSVPASWLVPFDYIKPTKSFPARPAKDFSRVRLIVPHEQGSALAAKHVYPCLYEITYQIW